MKTIAYIGDFSFSKMNAECQLVLGNARAFRKMGYDVLFIGNDAKWKNGEIYDGFQVYNVAYNKSLKDIIFIKKTKCYIEKLLELFKIDLVICYGTPTFAVELFFLRNWTRKYKIPFVINCVDIPNLCHGTILQRTIRIVDRKLRYKVYRNADGLISISEYIVQYFKTKEKKPFIIVPPIRSVEEYKKYAYVSSVYAGGPIKIIYAGYPFPTDGRKVSPNAYKDRLDLAIELVAKLVRQGVNIRLDIYGISYNEYLSVVGKHEALLKECSQTIFFEGQVSHEECMLKLADSDFLILLRDDSEMNRAGVSTKIVDAIVCGTKVITTRVGDIQKYLINECDVHYVDISDLENAADNLFAFFSSFNRYRSVNYAFLDSNYLNAYEQFFNKLLKK